MSSSDSDDNMAVDDLPPPAARPGSASGPRRKSSSSAASGPLTPVANPHAALYAAHLDYEECGSNFYEEGVEDTWREEHPLQDLQPLPAEPAAVRVDQVSKCQKAVFADAQLPADAYVGELRGLMQLRSAFEDALPRAQALSKRPCPYVFFHHQVDLCCDAREKGSAMRFVRRTCNPNAEVRLRQSNGHLALGLFTMHDVAKDDEITIAFDTPTTQIDYPVHCSCGRRECLFCMFLFECRGRL